MRQIHLLQGNALVPLLLAGAAAIALIVALFMWASAPDYRVLFNNLGEADGGTIINELESRGVPYQLSTGGQAILVPGDQVHVLRLQLAEQGLPQGGNVGFELMDNQSFGISQFAEQVNYQRSLEGELARSMSSMTPVANARVHISMAKNSVFIRDREPAKASVVLTLHGGRTLSQSQVNAIMHLVSSSVPELNSDNVTVVSHTGDLLSGSTGNNGIDGDNLSYTQEVERRYQQRIENILAPLYGKQNIRIQVAADIDFSAREETRETYRPNQDPNEAAIRSTQISGALRGADPAGAGVPGALSNTPPGWTPAQIEAQEGAGAEAAAQTDRNYQYDNVVNYEVDRNIMHIQHEQGQITRLSVAAVINYREGTDEEGNAIVVPLPEAELAQATNLIRQSMGFSDVRGDELEVVNSPFSQRFSEEIAAPEWWQDPQWQHLLITALRYLLVALVALFVWRRILNPLLGRFLQHTGIAAVPAVAGSAAGAAAPNGSSDHDLSQADMDLPPEQRLSESVGHIRATRKRKATSYELDLKEVREMANNDPRLIAMVVRSWMSKNHE